MGVAYQYNDDKAKEKTNQYNGVNNRQPVDLRKDWVGVVKGRAEKEYSTLYMYM